MRNSDTPRQVDSGCLDVLRSARLLLWLCRGGCAWCAPDIAALLGWLRSICVSPCGSVAAFGLGSRLLFDALRQTGRLAGCCVPIPPWVVIAISAFSSVVRLSGFMSSLLACAFSCGAPDGGRRRRGNAGTENGVGGEAECAFAQAYWLCRVFRGEYAGATRPRLRQRVFDSLDSLLWIRGKVPLAKLRNNRHPRITAPTPAAPGYTERPARVQFMLGRVVLY